ncbi:MAG TPA: hypothetical protein PLV30_04100, partial [Candidatus Marinimicrobia bacterium]|nr:hypothetical protein [Candidatus Neomarinimicrobiota bacterium]
ALPGVQNQRDGYVKPIRTFFTTKARRHKGIFIIFTTKAQRHKGIFIIFTTKARRHKGIFIIFIGQVFLDQWN